MCWQRPQSAVDPVQVAIGTVQTRVVMHTQDAFGPVWNRFWTLHNLLLSSAWSLAEGKTVTPIHQQYLDTLLQQLIDNMHETLADMD